jgi:hypothetical protein
VLSFPCIEDETPAVCRLQLDAGELDDYRGCTVDRCIRDRKCQRSGATAAATAPTTSGEQKQEHNGHERPT